MGDMVSLYCLGRLSVIYMWGLTEEAGFFFSHSFVLLYAALSGACVFQVQFELRLLKNYLRWNWHADILSGRRVLVWSNLGSVMFLLVLLFPRDVFTTGELPTSPHRAGDDEWPQESLVRQVLAMASGLRWFAIMYGLRGQQTFQFGMRVLPILAALREVTDFLVVMVFFMGGSMQMFYALSTRPILEVLFSSHRMGLLQDFDIKHDILGMAHMWEEAPLRTQPVDWYAWQIILFIATSFVIAVALFNIFIGVMSNAYDVQSGRAVELFVEARITIGLEYFAIHHYSDEAPSVDDMERDTKEDEYIWCCVPEEGNDQDNLAETTDTNSLRGLLQEVERNVSNKLARMDRKIDASRLVAPEAGRVSLFERQLSPAMNAAASGWDGHGRGTASKVDVERTRTESSAIEARETSAIEVVDARSSVEASEKPSSMPSPAGSLPGQLHTFSNDSS